MHPLLKKYPYLFVFISTLILALFLGACGDTGSINLSGAAGDATPTSEITEDPGAPAQVELPTATPIPPATGKIIFTSKRDGQTDLYMTSPDGSEISRISTNAAIDSSSTPRLSPDGTKIAYSATINNNTDIYILEIANGFISRVTDAVEKDSAPSWSPDGQRLAFESFRDGNLEIYVTNTDGSNQTRLTNDPAGDTNPVWSPVSNEIAFISGRFGNSDLFLLSPNGVVSTLTTSPAPDNTPSWSPDGNTIAFQTFAGELSNICLIGRDGLNQTCITPYQAEHSMPTWSGDGQWLAYHDQTVIQLYNRFSGNTIQLSQPGTAPRGSIAWAPDNLRLVFQAQTGEDFEIFQTLITTQEFTQITFVTGYDGEPVWAAR